MLILVVRMCTSEKAPPPAPVSGGGAAAPAGIPLRAGLAPEEKLTALVDERNLPQALLMYAELTGRRLLPLTNSPLERLDDLAGGRLSRWRLVRRPLPPNSGLSFHRDGRLSAVEVKEELEAVFARRGIRVEPVGAGYLRVVRPPGA
jgi:hypothetical protein